MTALLRTELRKCWSRRAVHLFGGLALAGIALAGVLVFINSAKPENSFHLVNLKQVYHGTSVSLIILGIALAASFMGAEWGAGTITTLLTWEPRRVRVYIAKLVAAVIFTFVSAIILQIILGAALLPSAIAHGSTAGADRAWLVSTAGSVARGALIAALGAGIGLAIGALARNTTAAVLSAFFYLFVLENLVRGLKPHWMGWLFGDNAAIFIVGHKLAGDSSAGPLLSHGPLQALLVVCAYSAILTAAAIALFVRRDVT
ncbi:MAG: ABC transporter permease [Actinomycetota bacterium]|nr:ABC transporter permease [Actinomycetota bacterium]